MDYTHLFFVYWLGLTVCSVLGQDLAFVPHNPATNTGDLDAAEFCEDLSPGTHIYTLEATGGTGKLKYTINSPDFLYYVELNEDTGVITLKEYFDYETNTVFYLAIVVEDDDGIEDTRNSRVYILDSNDNDPAFRSISYNPNIYEYPWTPEKLANFSVTDSDDGTAGSVTVTIQDRSDFIVTTQGTTERVYDVTLASTTELDYDSSPVVTLDMQAQDGGNAVCGNAARRSSTQRLIFQLKDGPDKPPFFTTPPQNRKISEDTPVGTEILQVAARDQDYGLDWEMSYAIVSDGSGQIERYFTLDPINGKLFLNKSINRENITDGTFRFQIMATEVVPPDDDPFAAKQSEIGYPFNTTTDISIAVTDINDNYPTFYRLDDQTDVSSKIPQSAFETTIDESIGNFIDIPNLNIYAEDADQPENAKFDIEIEGDDVPFGIRPAQITGGAPLTISVTDSAKLDYDNATTRSFTFTITATEVSSSGSSVKSHATVTINLNDTNDNSPIFDDDQLQVNLTENSPSGTTVVDLRATDLDSGDYGTVTYQVISDSAVFDVDTSGHVTVKEDARLDRETLDIYYVTIRASDGERDTMATVQVTLTDENDNAPVFQRNSYSASIEENAHNFTADLTVDATDADIGQNANITFTIIEGNDDGWFSISKESDSQAKITVVRALDVEGLPGKCDNSEKSIELVVMAEDGGSPPMSSRVPVVVVVQDINDNDPMFASDTAIVHVPEKTTTAISNFTAADADACAPNNEITYNVDDDLVDGRSGESLAFLIQTTTRDDGTSYGTLQVRDPNLDRDVTPEFHVLVLAVDSGNPRRTGTTSVTVVIDDVNEKAPVLEPATLEALDLSEKEAVGAIVREIRANDTDEDSMLVYNITDVTCTDENGISVEGKCDDWFSIATVGQIGKLSVSSELNRETAQNVFLTISVEDLNAFLFKPQRDFGTMQISISDTNDNAPVFITVDPVFEVLEHLAGANIGQVQAVDEDSGRNRDISYSVDPAFSNKIKIDNSSGQISTPPEGEGAAIDREVDGDWLNVTVLATDAGIPPLSSNTTVHIRIGDINDNNPQFEKTEYRANVSEGASVGTYVTRVHADDDDLGINAVIIYFILTGDSLAQFAVNRSTGELTVADELDRESTAVYRLTVRAQDSGNPPRYNDTDVEVTLDDVDDSTPVFTQADYEFANLQEIAANGTVVITVTANDPDDDSVVSYYMVADGGGKFAVLPDTGAVYVHCLVADCLAQGPARYELVVGARDQHGHSAAANLSVGVQDSNNHYPDLKNLPANVTVVETNEHALVYTVNVTDDDFDDNARISYMLRDVSDDTKGDSSKFTIDADGRISNVAILDYESNPVLQVMVVAHDNGPTQLSSSAVLTVHIDDLDDNSPYFEGGGETQQLSLPEGGPSESVVGYVQKASDRDSPANQNNFYYVTGGTGCDYFAVDAASRAITIIKDVDREQTPNYELVVQVTGNASFVPRVVTCDNVTWDDVIYNNSYLLVNVMLDDVNDNPPLFDAKIFDADVDYEQQPDPDDIITQVRASDADTGANAVPIYSITKTDYCCEGAPCDPAEGTFIINEESGNIYYIKSATLQQKCQFELIVQAEDSLISNYTDTAKVVIGVILFTEVVPLYSSIPPEDWNNDRRESFEDDMGKALNATVIIQKVIPASSEDELSVIQSEVFFYAKTSNGDLVGLDAIYRAMSDPTNAYVITKYGITGTIPSEVTDASTPVWVIVIIAVAAALLLITLFLSIAIHCMRTSYNRKKAVANASQRVISSFEGTRESNIVPTSNVHLNNPIYQQEEAIDLGNYFQTEETSDSDPRDDIDDNAVDNYDSAISGDRESNESLDDDLDNQFNIDFTGGMGQQDDDGGAGNDAAKLAAALNQANKRRGAENLTYLFDDTVF